MQTKIIVIQLYNTHCAIWESNGPFISKWKFFNNQVIRQTQQLAFDLGEFNQKDLLLSYAI